MKIVSLIYSCFGTWTHRYINCSSFYLKGILIQIKIYLVVFLNLVYCMFYCFHCWHLKLLLALWLVPKCLRTEVCWTYCITFSVSILLQLVMMAMTDLLKRTFLLANVRTRRIQRKTEVMQLWKARALLKRTQKWSECHLNQFRIRNKCKKNFLLMLKVIGFLYVKSCCLIYGSRMMSGRRSALKNVW